jgi:tyrosine-protein kinase Etk/Wzc
MEDFLDEERNASSFDFKYYLLKLKVNYKWICLGLIVSFLAAFLYLRYDVSKYQVDGYILVGGGDIEGGSNAILTNAGLISPTENIQNTIDNEIFILKSLKITGSVVDSLDLDINFTDAGRLKNQPVFKDSLPVKFIVRKPKGTADITRPLYKLTLTNKNFTLERDKENFVGRYDQSFILNKDTILISKNSNFSLTPDKSKSYTFQIQSRSRAIKKYLSRLTVAPAKTGGVGLLQLSIIDEIPVRAKRFIEVLIYSYNASYLVFKNESIRRALKFLNERLISVSTELSKQEDLVSEFKVANKLFDVSATAAEL